jgi:hypothetical protein
MNDSVLVHKHLIVRAEAINPPMDVQHLLLIGYIILLIL